MLTSHGVKFTTTFCCRYYNVMATLSSLCKETQMWIIHGRTVTFPLRCLNVVKKFNNDTTFGSNVKLVFVETQIIKWRRTMKE